MGLIFPGIMSSLLAGACIDKYRKRKVLLVLEVIFIVG